ncbi:MAG: hypothetical protein VCC67_09310 [Myxococcota bacterium]
MQQSRGVLGVVDHVDPQDQVETATGVGDAPSIEGLDRDPAAFAN